MTSNPHFVDTIVIGSGASGLSLTNLLNRSGRDVLCLEAHRTPGGSAGYFSRGKFCFDAGATTLSGMKFEGPLKQFASQCQLDFQLQRIDPGLQIAMGDKKLKRWGNINDWIIEQQSVFASEMIPQLWHEIEKYNELCWGLVSDSANFPPYNFQSLKELLAHRTGSKIQMLPLILQTFEKKFLRGKFLPAGYLRMLDEMMLISSQNTSDKTPAMIAVMGLSYPQDTWYASGGMRGFFDHLMAPVKERVLFQKKIESIQQEKDLFEVKTSTESFHCRNLVSTLPYWNTQKLLGKLDRASMDQWSSEAWSALSGYYKIKLKTQPASLYHQVHTQNVSHSGAGSVFLSLCPLTDISRCDGIYQTLTLSTHIRFSEYQRAIMIDRKTMRARWNQEFEQVIKDYFGDDLLDLISVGIGDPSTFEKYTGRERGLVGGLPHSMRRNILTYPRSGTGMKNFHQLGDTTFPGQGIVGVIQGAINLHQRMML